MRNLRLRMVLIAAALLAVESALASPVSVSVSFFHEQLSPHGRWVTAASYGDVWIPSGVAAGWEPYVDGEWVYTDYGWTWIADDPWGDIPYHYGTWAWVDPYGWVWIPGTVWAPAWVTWAYTDDYIGWAPVPPTFVLSVRGYFGPPVVVPATRYIFVPAPKFVGVRVATVRVPPQQNVVIYKRAAKTTRYEVSNGIVRVAGPSPKKVEKALGRPIERVPADRARIHPTSLAAAGVTHTKSIRVIAPERERKAKAAAPKAVQKAEAPKSVEKKDSKKEQAAPARASSSQGHAKPEHAAAPSGPSTKTVASEKPESHRDTVAERPKATAQKPAKHQSAEREKAPAAKPPSEPKVQREAASSAEHRPPQPPPAKKKAAKQPPPKEKKEKEPPADHPRD